MPCSAKSMNICETCNKGKGCELDNRGKLCIVGSKLGFEVEDEWSPPKLKHKFSRREKYLPKIDARADMVHECSSFSRVHFSFRGSKCSASIHRHCKDGSRRF